MVSFISWIIFWAATHWDKAIFQVTVSKAMSIHITVIGATAYWSHKLRDGAPIVPPGVLSGGPNNDNMSDPIATHQIGKCAAQTCWTDHYTAWTQNEITINWNAPLVWIASFLDETAPPNIDN